jgi:hypothetical protein
MEDAARAILTRSAEADEEFPAPSYGIVQLERSVCGSRARSLFVGKVGDVVAAPRCDGIGAGQAIKGLIKSYRQDSAASSSEASARVKSRAL